MPPKKKPVKSPERCARSGQEIKKSGRGQCGACAWSQYPHTCPVDGAPIEISEVMRPAQAAPSPASRWTQFETQVLANLRGAREMLAKAGGMAEADGFVIWAGEERELAGRVQALTKKIEENAARVLQESCR